ncbi:Rhamnogalacturonan acetylesterase RhgT [Posidoniimonas polymericola]|uniref:Rhamnogalacturonan acetylesterase RhgT n=1 Tax=Posidoniimonas polymericola TaxID=2528002 RepID=A0A5C5YKV0_9BACT|nr:rhamnogalacturonan acetylesterase [Posidoniimonas polymericola]TWT75543.1 Rhamnogalacturonan acetylesterase RhgT [Posidoniimonas polymericola]
MLQHPTIASRVSLLAGFFGLAAGVLLAAPSASAADTGTQGNQTASAPPRPATLFLIGDSTVKNGSGKGDGGLWGWGQVLQSHFDLNRLVVENRALGGRSSRTYLTEGLWAKTLDQIQPGDYVLMQFGHNDGGKLFESDRPRASLPGNGDDVREGTVVMTGKHQTVHSYGWYLRKYIAETKQKGATPIVLSPIPRDQWREGHVVRAGGDYGQWAKDAAAQAGADFVDLNTIVADRYDETGQAEVQATYFTPTDHTHTSEAGAKLNAACVVAGIRGLNDHDLKQFLLPPSNEPAARLDFGVAEPEAGFTGLNEAVAYSDEHGYGFLNTSKLTFPSGDRAGSVSSDAEFMLSIIVPDRNHLVRVTFGSPTRPSATSVECELRRRMTDEVRLQAGQFETKEFLVNTRTKVLPHGKQVRLKPREEESESVAWDSRLSLRFYGENPSVAKLEVLPAPAVPTVYLLGDSTVADQYVAPWASWGQKLPRYFGSNAAVANHSESGETIAASWSRGRCDKILYSVQPGDWLLIQFGHNDMKSKRDDAVQRYREDLRRLVVAARERGAAPVLVTSMERKSGIEQDTLGAYPQTMRDLAAEEQIPLIDLHARSRELYRVLGSRVSDIFQDGTHHNDLGAEMLAACVVDGIRANLPGLAELLTDAEPVRPQHGR